MDTKLTLKLDKEIIEKAKKYAKAHNQSLSKMVEKYFRFLSVEEENDKMGLSPTVKALAGIISLDKDFDHKGAYQDYLKEKYK